MTNLIDTDEFALVGGGNEVATVMGLTKARRWHIWYSIFLHRRALPQSAQ